MNSKCLIVNPKQAGEGFNPKQAGEGFNPKQAGEGGLAPP